MKYAALAALTWLTFGCGSQSAAPPAPPGKQAVVVAKQPRQKGDGSPKRGPAQVRLSALAVSPDGKLLASGYALTDRGERTEWLRDQGRLVKVWDVASGKCLQILRGHDDGIVFVAFLPDNERVVTAGDSTLKMWDVRNGKQLWSAKAHARGTRQAALSPDGKLVLSWGFEAKDGGTALKLWDAATGAVIRRLGRYDGQPPFGGVLFTPDSRRAFLYTNPLTTDPHLLDVATGEPVPFFKEGEPWRWPRAFSPDGKLVLSERREELGSPFRLVLWRLDGGAVVRRFDARLNSAALGTGSDVSQAAAFTPDGKRVLSSDRDGGLRTWDVVTGKRISTVPLFEPDPDPTGILPERIGPPEKVIALLFSPDTKWAVSSNGGSKTAASIIFSLWDTASGKLIRRLREEP